MNMFLRQQSGLVGKASQQSIPAHANTRNLLILPPPAIPDLGPAEYSVSRYQAVRIDPSSIPWFDGKSLLQPPDRAPKCLTLHDTWNTIDRARIYLCRSRLLVIILLQASEHQRHGCVSLFWRLGYLVSTVRVMSSASQLRAIKSFYTTRRHMISLAEVSGDYHVTASYNVSFSKTSNGMPVGGSHLNSSDFKLQSIKLNTTHSWGRGSDLCKVKSPWYTLSHFDYSCCSHIIICSDTVFSYVVLGCTHVLPWLFEALVHNQKKL